jgi:hypothetical protein
MSKDTPTPSPEGHGSPSSPNPEPVNLALTDTPVPSGLPEHEAGAPEQPPGDPKAELAAISQNGNTNRLSPADEDKATRLMHKCLLEGGDGISAALAAMPQLPWILGVRAIENAWKDLPAEARATVLDGLAKMDTDNGYRLRLSMARSLARVELPEAVKVAAASCRSMWNGETGTLKPEHSKLIGNVFIGRGKPWVLQLVLADLPPEDATAILSAVVFSTFNVNNAPITQLSVLRYAGARLGQLHENLVGMVARAVGRWSGKWQSALRKEVPELPEAVLSALKADSAPEPREPRRRNGDEAPAEPAAEVETPLPPELEEKLRLAAETEDPAAVEAVNQEINAWREAEKIARLEALDAEDDEDEDEDEADDEEDDSEPAAEEGGGRRRRGRNDRKERPTYVPRDQESRAASGFNFGALIKQLESYVSGLRNDLATAQNRLRRADDDGRKSRREDRPVLSHDEANLSPDELKRLVIQLEGRVEELKSRVEELTTDSEARALAMAAGTADAAPDAVTQLRTLLALKLQEDYADFLTLQKESPDAIVQQHYRGLINHVFEVLRGEQIPLSVPAEPVVAPPLPPAMTP